MTGEHSRPTPRRIGVLLPMPLPVLDYAVPEGAALKPGDFIEVELGRRRMAGIVWDEGDGTLPEAKLKPAGERLDIAPMQQAMRRFLAMAAEYTMTPPGLMLRLATRVPDLGQKARMRTVLRPGPATPARMTPGRERVLAAASAERSSISASDLARKAGVSTAVIRGLVQAGALLAIEIPADAPYPELSTGGRATHLSPAQHEIAESLRHEVAAGRFGAVLLHGVTGSGKTEVYLEAVAECIARGRQALVLLPEVALTSAFIDRVEARFGARPGEWHHGIAGAERRRLWHASAAGKVQLVVGARSALFLPFRDLGLIIVDEEHEPSFKQEDSVHYHARDMAVLRASIEGAAVVLASATPSLETWANAKSGKYRRLDLPERFGAAVLPDIRLIDLRSHNPGRDRWISEPLIKATQARLRQGEQVLLFLNRRGYAPLTLCRACAHHFGCPDCDSWMVTHRHRAELLCHQCGHVEKLPSACPSCGREDRLAIVGPGVERLAEEAAALFPEARVEVLSSDLATGPAELRARLNAIAAGEADIIIGTQMIAKGHNFPKLTLVGVIDADMGLQGGDLRAGERTFQILHQVAGRAGRGDRRGLALIQTVAPEHPVLRAIISGASEAFWEQEAEMRRHAGAPPYGRLAAVIVSGVDDAKVWEVANALGRAAPLLTSAGAEVFGPAPAPFARLRGRSRVRLLIKAPKGLPLQKLLARWRASVRCPSSVAVAIDIDPQSFL